MQRKISLMVFFLAVTLIPASAYALKFSNQFVEFELPTAKWNCSLEGAEWVCQSSDKNKKRDAIIVLAAKLKGDQDTLDKYQEYLGGPRKFKGPGGKAITSKPKYSRISQINGHPWVDAMHMESEIPGFYTRYLATVKKDIGVLVTYSVNKNKYQQYLTQFEVMVKSLKVFRKKGGLLAKKQDIFQNNQLPGDATEDLFPDDSQIADAGGAKKKKKASSDDDDLMLFLLLGVAVVGFIIWKKRKQQQG